MKTQIKFLVNAGYELSELVLMTPKGIKSLYRKEVKLLAYLIPLTNDEIFEQDARALMAAQENKMAVAEIYAVTMIIVLIMGIFT